MKKGKKEKIDISKMLPIPVTGVDMAFGGDIDKLLPDYDSIPEEFTVGCNHNKWNKIFSNWFFHGLDKDTDFIPKDGIDPKAALQHISAIMKSWAPKHEHKEAGCAYLLQLWFKDIIVPEKKTS